MQSAIEGDYEGLAGDNASEDFVADWADNRNGGNTEVWHCVLVVVPARLPASARLVVERIERVMEVAGRLRARFVCEVTDRKAVN